MHLLVARRLRTRPNTQRLSLLSRLEPYRSTASGVDSKGTDSSPATGLSIDLMLPPVFRMDIKVVAAALRGTMKR